MGSVYYKQPNGRYCRYSTVVDCVTHYNMTEDDILQLFIERAVSDAIRNARNFVSNKKNFYPFKELTKLYSTPEPSGEMSVEDFNRIKAEMIKPTNEFTLCRTT